MLGLGWTEMLLIAALALIVVGPRDLPVMLRQLGRAFGIMRRMGNEFKSEFNKMAAIDEVRDIRKSITDPLRNAQAEIQREFNKTTATGVKPSGALKPDTGEDESVVNAIKTQAGMNANPADEAMTTALAKSREKVPDDVPVELAGETGKTAAKKATSAKTATSKTASAKSAGTKAKPAAKSASKPRSKSTSAKSAAAKADAPASAAAAKPKAPARSTGKSTPAAKATKPADSTPAAPAESKPAAKPRAARKPAAKPTGAKAASAKAQAASAKVDAAKPAAAKPAATKPARKRTASKTEKA